MTKEPQRLKVTKEQIEILARRLLPEVKKFFADENIQKEFMEWQKKRKEQDR